MFKLLKTNEIDQANTGFVMVVLSRHSEELSVVESIHGLRLMDSEADDILQGRMDYFKTYYQLPTCDEREILSHIDLTHVGLADDKDRHAYVGRLGVIYENDTAVMCFKPIVHAIPAGTTTLTLETFKGTIDQYLRVFSVKPDGSWEFDDSIPVNVRSDIDMEVWQDFKDVVLESLQSGVSGQLLCGETYPSWSVESLTALSSCVIEVMYDVPHVPAGSDCIEYSISRSDPNNESAFLPIRKLVEDMQFDIYGADGIVAYVAIVDEVRLGVNLTDLDDPSPSPSDWLTHVDVTYVTPVVRNVPLPYAVGIVKFEDGLRIVGKLIPDTNAAFLTMQAINAENNKDV